MSGVEGSTACRPPNPQLPLCDSSRFAKSCPQNRSGSYPALLAKSRSAARHFCLSSQHSALSCGMILLCDLSRMAATSTLAGSGYCPPLLRKAEVPPALQLVSAAPFPSGGAPFRVMPQNFQNFRKLVGSARRREKRAPRRDEVPREDERASGPRLLRRRASTPQVRRQCSTRRRTEDALTSDCKSLMLLKAVVSSRGPAGAPRGTRSALLGPRHVYLNFCPVLS
jgi:hypothetical protein